MGEEARLDRECTEFLTPGFFFLFFFFVGGDWGGFPSHSLQFINLFLLLCIFLLFFSYLSLNIPVWCSLFLII